MGDHTTVVQTIRAPFFSGFLFETVRSCGLSNRDNAMFIPYIQGRNRNFGDLYMPGQAAAMGVKAPPTPLPV